MYDNKEIFESILDDISKEDNQKNVADVIHDDTDKHPEYPYETFRDYERAA